MPGRTTEAELLALLGPPTQVTSNKTVSAPGFGSMPSTQRIFVYTYSRYPFLTPSSGPPTRIATFGLNNGILRLAMVISSFESDQPAFDDAAVKALVASPQSGLHQAISVLGQPQTRYAGPDGSTGAGWYVIRRSKDPDQHPILTRMLIIKYGPDCQMSDHRLDIHEEP